MVTSDDPKDDIPDTARRREVLRAEDISDADLAAIMASEMDPRHSHLDQELEDHALLDIYDLRRTCIAAPSQWDGRVGERGSIYIRYRGGIMRAHVSLTTTDAYKNGEVVFDEDVGSQIGDRGGGYLETSEMQALLAHLFRFHGPCDELAHTRY
jgi:hypothetical protein